MTSARALRGHHRRFSDDVAPDYGVYGCFECLRRGALEEPKEGAALLVCPVVRKKGNNFPCLSL